jgi:hypothetical protein
MDHPPVHITGDAAEAIRLEDEARELEQIDRAIASIEEREAAALAHTGTVAAFEKHSVRLGPLERLAREREFLLRRLGGDADAVAIPKRAAAGEKDLPEDAREIHRRSAALHGALKVAHAKHRVEHEQKKAKVKP